MFSRTTSPAVFHRVKWTTKRKSSYFKAPKPQPDHPPPPGQENAQMHGSKQLPSNTGLN